MKLLAQLVHAESGKRVVLVQAYDGERLLGSALGEAADAEAAEDRARQRLLARLSPGQRQAASAAASDRPAPTGGENPDQPRTIDTASDPPQAGERSVALEPTTPIECSASRPAAEPARPRPATTPAPVHTAAANFQRTPASAPGAGIAAASPRDSADGREPGAPTEPWTASLSPLEAAASAPADGSTPSHGSAQANGPLPLERAGRGERTGQGDGSGPGPESVPAARADNGQAGEPPSRIAPPLRRVADPVPPVSPRQPTTEPPPDPEDWSGELAALELQLRRLGWQRDQEAAYLQRAFGHPSRNRLTNYGDLLAYLHTVEGLEVGADPATAPVPLRRSELLSQCDALLIQLGWDAEQGRALLERELQVASRQQLNDQQLLHFNMLLESEMLAASQGQAPALP